MFVNLIRKDEHVEFLAQTGDKFHLFAGENLASRIIRVTNNNRFGFLVKGGAQFFAVYVAASYVKANQSGNRALQMIDTVRHDIIALTALDATGRITA